MISNSLQLCPMRNIIFGRKFLLDCQKWIKLVWSFQTNSENLSSVVKSNPKKWIIVYLNNVGFNLKCSLYDYDHSIGIHTHIGIGIHTSDFERVTFYAHQPPVLCSTVSELESQTQSPLIMCSETDFNQFYCCF